MELEQGQSDGSGSSQKPRLRAALAPKPWCRELCLIYGHEQSVGLDKAKALCYLSHSL